MSRFRSPSGLGTELVSVFTTRVDTIFGVTALVIAPEHPLVRNLIERGESGLADFVGAALRKSNVERQAAGGKDGFKTSLQVRNPLTDQLLDVYVADYVLPEFGSGAVMCVPAHDQRDFDFAKRYDLPIIPVITPPHAQCEQECFEGDGVLTASAQFSQLSSADAREQIADYLETRQFGIRHISFGLRDWCASRQRYWGCPIPIVYCDNCDVVPLEDKDLPVLLPKAVPKEDGRIQLHDQHDFINTSCPHCGGPARRETDTLDTFVDSAWYAFRYIDTGNTTEPFSSEKVNKWFPINFYVGALEHAAQHMLYFRFFTKVLHREGLISFDEPVERFFANGIVTLGGHKMSKSRGNVVVPTEIVQTYGADALRLYMLSDTPADQGFEWDERGLERKRRFLDKLYVDLNRFLTRSTVAEEAVLTRDVDRQFLSKFYNTVQSLSKQLESGLFHNAVARIYELASQLSDKIKSLSDPLGKEAGAMRQVIKDFLTVTGVICPYFTEDLLEMHFDRDKGIYQQQWPIIDEAILQCTQTTLVVSVDGKKKGTIQLERGLDEEAVKNAVIADSQLTKFLQGKNIIRCVLVPDKIINFVTD